ncbi:carbon monoxide dehydrogenase [Streptomyces sp. R302]|uniref:SRPBCC family protein n=1 Tax=unclassified Streptomyces TaxID=2593676 RepID=UPI00145E7F5A|nr:MULTISPECIES: SRPBCC family protein [unclassified Streptomyces]NML52255.1 carbon monoxide dehydrogenase [Streptomyces sp. R301]NML82279.1 carbon monoxide dehydrogenase [Streptomyces sp. R302]
MEHEVFVPVPAEALRATLTDPARVARCVPGLQRDASADPEDASPAGRHVVGRFRLRVGGHTITYRGGLRIVERDGAITYEGEGTEARGKGAAEVSLTVVLTPAAEGTGLSFTGALTATGRLAEEPEEARDAARDRLLDAFVEAAAALAAEAAAEETAGEAVEEEAPGEQTPGDATSFGTGAFGGAGDAEAQAEPGTDADADAKMSGFADDVRHEPAAAPEFPAAKPAAEAAHARRTMIGRSAEEVDHAPPRGRYAPVPAPAPSGAGATLRWVAPAAALALASAVVVTRALRRRR